MLFTSTERLGVGIGRTALTHVRAFRLETARNVPLVALAVGYAAAVSGVADIRLPTISYHFFSLLEDLCVYGLATAMVLGFANVVFVARPRSPIGQLANGVRSVLDGSELARWFARIWTFALLAAAFSMFKPAISGRFGGFAWDANLAEFGRILHFGYMPWRLLQPLFGYPWITRLLDINYALWFAIMWVFVIGMVVFCRDDAHRQRALVGFMLVWIAGGTCLAAGFSSAGPCYYGHVVAGPNPYAELMAYLEKVHDSIGLIAVDAQAALWKDYASGQLRIGISAMPSMHNAVAGLMVLACRRLDRRLRLALTVHALLVFVGSILLGWHYGADAYVGWACAFVAWKVADPVTRWWSSRCDGLPSKTPVLLPA